MKGVVYGLILSLVCVWYCNTYAYFMREALFPSLPPVTGKIENEKGNIDHKVKGKDSSS